MFDMKMEKQESKPRKLKVYMIIILILLVPILFLTINAYGYNDNLHWRGGSGNISDESRWYKNNGNSNCWCIPKWIPGFYNNVYFDSNSGSGTVYLDMNISSGSISLSNTNITIVLLNNTKWTINGGFAPALINPNPAFDVGQTLFSAFYILVFVTLCILFIMGSFWVRKVRGKIG